jgi:hypothetical protein
LNAALAAVADCFSEAAPDTQVELVQIARQMAVLRAKLCHPDVSGPVVDERNDGESDEALQAREDAESERRIAVKLAEMGLADRERQFALGVGERIVEMVSDLYVQANMGTHGYDAACITAAITVALMVVYDPPIRARGGAGAIA